MRMRFSAVSHYCFMQEAYHGLIFMRGMGAQVKNTVSSRKDFRPHTSDRAPINGALRKDNRPCVNTNPHHFLKCHIYSESFENNCTARPEHDWI